MESLTSNELTKICNELDITLIKSDGSRKLKKKLINQIAGKRRKSSKKGSKRKSRIGLKKRKSRKVSKKKSRKTSRKKSRKLIKQFNDHSQDGGMFKKKKK